MTEYTEDHNENEDDGIFIISQKFQEVSNQGLGRFNRFVWFNLGPVTGLQWTQWHTETLDRPNYKGTNGD